MFRMTTEATKFSLLLDHMGSEYLKKATARTLNAISTGAAGQQIKNVQTEMIVRTPYTLKSLKRLPASENRPISRQNAIVGSTSPYLTIHDDGGTIRAKNKKIPIPTNVLRGKDRRKRISPSMRIGASTRFFVLSPGPVLKAPGIFIRKSKRKIVKVRDLSQSKIRIKPNHWHTEAVLKYSKYTLISSVFIREAKKLMPTSLPK